VSAGMKKCVEVAASEAERDEAEEDAKLTAIQVARSGLGTCDDYVSARMTGMRPSTYTMTNTFLRVCFRADDF